MNNSIGPSCSHNASELIKEHISSTPPVLLFKVVFKLLSSAKNFNQKRPRNIFTKYNTTIQLFHLYQYQY